MGSEINLVPEYIKKREERSRNIAVFSKVVMLFLFISLGLLGVSYYFKSKIIKEVLTLDSQISSTEKSISLLNETRVKLSLSLNRLETIKGLISQRNNYSVFFYEIEKLVPQGVIIGDVVINDPKKVSLKGLANTYSLLSDFLSTLGKSSLQDSSIFMESSLSEVSLVKESGRISFSMEISLKEGALLSKD